MAGPNSFSFIVSTDPSTFKDTHTQTLIRKHASRIGSRSRQAKFVLERHNPRQLPPEIQLPSSQAPVRDSLQGPNIFAQHAPKKWCLKDAMKAKADVESNSVVGSVSGIRGLVSTEPRTSHAGASKQPICRLSGDWSILDHTCPIVLDLTTRRLLHRLLDPSPSNRFGGYRDAWLPVVLSDAAAFQQYLSTFALHLQRADPSLSDELNVPMLMLHAQSLQAVNHRLRSPEAGTDKGLLAAVISFIAHYQAQQRYDMWQVHMHGLENIIALHGGPKQAFSNNPRLHIILFFINVQGSWLQDLPFIFPPPYDLLPQIRDLPICPSILSSFQNATQASRRWRVTFPERWQIPDIIDDLAKVTAHLISESNRTNGISWRNSMTTGLLLNPLVFRLYEIRVKQSNYRSRSMVLQETFRIAALLFIRRTKWHAFLASSVVDSQVVKLRSWLEDASEDDWIGFETLKSWVLVMGACSSTTHSAERLWFEKEILHMVRLMQLANPGDMLILVKSVLWIEDLFGETVQVIEKELRMIA